MDWSEMNRLAGNMIAAANRQTLRDELPLSGLPDLAQRQVEKDVMRTFAARAATTGEIRERIGAEKTFLTEFAARSDGQVNVGIEQPERMQAALDKLFAVEVDAKFRDVKPFGSLRAAYTALTGDPEMRGFPSPEGYKLGESFMQWMRLPAAFSSSTFQYALGNTMYRRLVAEYKAVNYGEEYLVSYERNAPDFRPQNSILVGYFSDLPDVNPEILDYTEVTMVDDSQVSYTINQKGAILTITRRTLINDDLKTIQALVSRLGRAAKRTFARRGWNLLINNTNWQPDGLPIFHIDHGNLAGVLLTNDATGIGALTAAKTAMYAQTEKDSGEVLSLGAMYEMVPRALQETARALNQPWPMGGIFNPHAGSFGRNDERIITVPFLTAPRDWYLVADKNDVELLEVAYLQGQKEPEVLLADNPVVGQMFVADKLQYKIRHEYEWAVIDYRGLYKSMNP